MSPSWGRKSQIKAWAEPRSFRRVLPASSGLWRVPTVLGVRWLVDTSLRPPPPSSQATLARVPLLRRASSTGDPGLAAVLILT